MAIGQKRKAGDFRTLRCISVMVREKMLPEELRRRRKTPFPKTIRVSYKGKRYNIPVDVTDSPQQPIIKLQGLAAAPVYDSRGRHAGATGAVVSRGTDRFVTTAAHVVLTAGGSSFTVVGSSGPIHTTVKASDVFFGDNLDCALLSATGSLPADAARVINGTKLEGLRAATPWLVGKTAFVHHALTGQRVVSTVRQVDAVATVPVGPTNQTFSSLIAIDAITDDGDSGTLLYDSERRALGTLLGRMGSFSYFVSIHRTCVQLKLKLEL